MLRTFLLLLVLVPALPCYAEEPTALPQAATEAVAFPVRVDRIVLQGLKRTREEVVLRELPFHVGDTIDEATWRFGATRLWNATLFNQVTPQISRETTSGQVVATFLLEENWTLNPLFSFAAGGNAAWVRVGLSESNFLGRFLEVGSQYERFGEHNGFQGWIRDPRFLGKRLDWVVLVERLVRPRPDFADQRLRFATEVNGLMWNDRLRLTAKVEALHDTLLPLSAEGSGDAPRRWSVLAEWGVRIGRVDTVRVRQQGVSLEVRQSIVATDLGTTHGYTQGWLELLALQTLGDRWNLAGRFQMGAQGDAPEFLQFYLGGLTVVRGYVDNFVRTHRYALFNAEARFVAFDSSWVALVAAGFVDGAVAQRLDGTVQPLLASGAGMRFLLPWMVKTGLRVDLAIPIVAATCPRSVCPNLSVGVFQFF